MKDVEIDPRSDTHKMKLEIRGDFTCKSVFYINSDGEKYDSLILNGAIDTSWVGDWYENKLTFDISNVECVNEASILKVTLYH